MTDNTMNDGIVIQIGEISKDTQGCFGLDIEGVLLYLRPGPICGCE